MFKKEYLAVFIIIGLAIAYAFLSILDSITKGKWARAVKRKIAIGTMIIAFSAFLASGQTAHSWWWNPTPTPTIEPTDEPTIEPTPLCYTPTPSATPPPQEITDEPTLPPTPTPFRQFIAFKELSIILFLYIFCIV